MAPGYVTSARSWAAVIETVTPVFARAVADDRVECHAGLPQDTQAIVAPGILADLSGERHRPSETSEARRADRGRTAERHREILNGDFGAERGQIATAAENQIDVQLADDKDRHHGASGHATTRWVGDGS